MQLGSTVRLLVVSSVLLCLIELCACSKEVDGSKVSGTYEARHRNGVEIIELRPDGTYTQYFTAPDGMKSTFSNNWRFERFDGEPKLALQGFTSHFPEAQKADVILLDVDRDGGRMRLYRSYDLDQYYLKAAPK